MEHYTNGLFAGKTESHGKIPPQAGGASHRKSNSYSEASPNADLRTREYLTEAEVERLLKATKGNHWAHRDATMILVAYRHGLRASELTDLRWDQVDFATATLHVRRVKQGS